VNKGGRSNAVQLKLISSRNTAVMRMMGRHMISVTECAKKNGVGISRIHKLIRSDRIPGAYQTENGWWLIPAEWEHKRRTGLEPKALKSKSAKKRIWWANKKALTSHNK